MTVDHYARIADLYDRFVRTDADLPFFLSEAQQAGGRVLELMAGTGRLTLPLAEAGVPLVAVDYSAEMLAILREKLAVQGLQADVHEMDVREMQLDEQFPLIILPFQAFPEITDLHDQKRALQAIRRHLQPGGRFICTLHNPPVRLRSVDNQLHLAVSTEDADGGTLMVWLLQRHDAGRQQVEVLEFFEEYDASGLITRKRYSSLKFHLLADDRFAALAEETGFKVEQIYGDYAYAPFDADSSPFMIWVLRHSG